MPRHPLVPIVLVLLGALSAAPASSAPSAPSRLVPPPPGLLVPWSPAMTPQAGAAIDPAEPLAGPSPPSLDGDIADPRDIEVNGAGDINGDGSSDWVEGRPRATGALGAAAAGHVRFHLRTAQGTSTLELPGTEANGWFGTSVAPAGDVDGDGYDDVIVGAPGEAGFTGRAYLFRGSAAGVRIPAAWAVQGAFVGGRFGFTVAGAGDVNADGYDDVLVAAPVDTTAGGLPVGGAVYVFHGSQAGLATTPARVIRGTDDYEYCGIGLDGDGDVNADGYADVIIGSPYFTDTASLQGRARIYLGGPGGLAATPAWSRQLDAAFSTFGYAVAMLGDLDGDGFGDFGVGAPFSTNLENGDGAFYMYGGRAVAAESAYLIGYVGGAVNMTLGLTLAGAGDLNGDGFADLAVGAPYFGDFNDGFYAVIFGSTDPATASGNGIIGFGHAASQSGISLAGGGDVGDGVGTLLVGHVSPPGTGVPAGLLQPAEPWVLVTGTSTLDALGVAPAFGFTVGPPESDGFGRSLAIGDFDGDGYDDIAVGSSNDGPPNPGRGRIMVFRGDAGGLGRGVPTQFDEPDWTYTYGLDWGQLGFDLANAGDVNGDGYADLIAGAPFATIEAAAEGEVLLFHGGPAGLGLQPAWRRRGHVAISYYGSNLASAGDVNQDGYDDVLIGANGAEGEGVVAGGQLSLHYGSRFGLSYEPVRVFVGTQSYGGTGEAAGVGDVDGDGFPDVVLGEPGWSGPEPAEGRALLYRGGAAGLEASPSWSFQVDQSQAGLGYAVSPAGDVNGDGYADFLVGAPRYSNGEEYEGAAFLFLGSPTGPALAPTSVLESNVIWRGYGVTIAPAGDIDKDGYDDVIVGGTDNFAPPGTVRGGGPRLDGQTGGRVGLHAGRVDGLDPSPRLVFNSSGPGQLVGFAIAGGGDLDGDGWPDFAYSTPNQPGGVVSRGLVTAVYTNHLQRGFPRPVQARRSDSITPIAPGLWSDANGSFRLAARGRTPAGRDRIRLEWQVRPNRDAFTTAPLGATSFLRTSSPTAGAGSSIPLFATVGSLPTGSLQHWRARYASRHPLFPRSRWFTPRGGGARLADLRTAGLPGPVDAGAPVSAGLWLGGARPNPLSVGGAPSSLAWSLPAAGRVTIDVHDVSGRRVARVFDADRPAGPGATPWNGSDDSGRPLPGGVYFLRLDFAGEARTTKVVLAR